MYVFNEWLMYSGFPKYLLHPNPELYQQDIYSTLEEKLIYNNKYRKIT